MALIGTWKEYRDVTPLSGSGDETWVTHSITYPADIAEDDPNYELRGTTVEEYDIEKEFDTTDHEGAYALIFSGNHYRGLGGSHHFNYEYRVYGSEASRSVSIDNYLEAKMVGGISWDFDNFNDAYTTAYSDLKQRPGFELMEDNL